MSRPKAKYEIIDDKGFVLSAHRTRQAAVDTWRTDHIGMPVTIWRRTNNATVKIVEGTWHEAQRPYNK
ncbi:MAG: hypothetical protein R2733_06270 [Acidimicrobiales bacterium]